MSKYFSTLFYSIQGFMKSESELYDVDSILDFNAPEFEDVYRCLDKSKMEPSQKSIDNILAYCNSTKQKVD